MTISTVIAKYGHLVPFPHTVIDPFESPVTTSPFGENSMQVKYCGISYFCQTEKQSNNERNRGTTAIKGPCNPQFFRYKMLSQLLGSGLAT